MNGKCFLGFHEWTGCKCTRCAKIRSEGHDWAKDCEKCTTCGTTRQGSHDWDGCRCKTCGKTRDEGHHWQHCKCSVCGKLRNESHSWQHCKCSICGTTRDEDHDWNYCKCGSCGRTRNESHNWQDGKCALCGKIACEQVHLNHLLREVILLLKNGDFEEARRILDAEPALRQQCKAVSMIVTATKTQGSDDPGYVSGEQLAGWIRNQTRTVINRFDSEIRNTGPLSWEEVKAKYSQYISIEIEDGAAYNVRLHTCYRDYSHADRALGMIGEDAAAVLSPTQEGMSDQSGTSQYHVVHEGRLAGSQIKQYLLTVVEAGGIVWGVFQ